MVVTNRTNAILGLIAETPVHPGTGQNIGGVDLPIQREGHTGLPTIPASSLKGSLREICDSQSAELLFGAKLGSEAHFAGAVALTDCRLLALPIRSSSSLFVWVTSSYMVGRLERDLSIIGLDVNFGIVDIQDGSTLVPQESSLSGKLLLEDVILETKKDTKLSRVARVYRELTMHDAKHRTAGEKISRDLVLVSNTTMAHLSKYGTVVAARNQLEELTKKSNNLWYAEMVPADTLFYSLVMASSSRNGSSIKSEDVLDQFVSLVKPGYLQLGGNETIGSGWVSAKLSSLSSLQGFLFAE